MPPNPAASTTVPLPPTIARTLTQIAADLTDMPRECARDHGELCLWKGRLARRIRGVLTMRVPVAHAGSPNAPLAGIPARDTATGAATGRSHPAVRKRGVRTILGQKGRMIRVEARQLEMQV